MPPLSFLIAGAHQRKHLCPASELQGRLLGLTESQQLRPPFVRSPMMIRVSMGKVLRGCERPQGKHLGQKPHLSGHNVQVKRTCVTHLQKFGLFSVRPSSLRTRGLFIYAYDLKLSLFPNLLLTYTDLSILV